MQDKPQILEMRQRYVRELVEARHRVSTLTAKIQMIDEILGADVPKPALKVPPPAPAIVQGYSPAPSIGPTTITPAIAPLPLASKGPTEAARWVVENFGVERSLTIMDIKNAVLAHGFQPKGKHFTGAIAKALKRLAKDIIAEEKVDGVLRYRAKSLTSEPVEL
jgi:hypothetical protein